MTNRFLIGRTGAQGVPIVQELSQHGYHVRVLTRDADSERVDYAFIAVQTGVKHCILSSLDNYASETKYDDTLRCGHYYGKGRVTQWISALPQSPMKWSVVTTGTYIEQLWYFQHPKKLGSGEYELSLPLNDGAIPYVCLDDLAYYVRWVLEHPEKCDSGQIAKVFTAVTGKPAKATNVTVEQWMQGTGLPEDGLQHKTETSLAPSDPSLLTFYQNVSAWWRIYQNCYNLLDEIFPGRIRSLKQWMEKVGYDGDGTRTFEAGILWGL
ncbi:hypothetical protein V8C42DRAFT_350800 [Trichoderma barbatum]